MSSGHPQYNWYKVDSIPLSFSWAGSSHQVRSMSSGHQHHSCWCSHYRQEVSSFYLALPLGLGLLSHGALMCLLVPTPVAGNRLCPSGSFSQAVSTYPEGTGMSSRCSNPATITSTVSRLQPLCLFSVFWAHLNEGCRLVFQFRTAAAAANAGK